jgi:Transglycosylase SLT domain
MQTPSPELWEVFTAAATEARVPATLLAAVAWQESRYKGDAVGTVTKAGWQARGMMQLSPTVLKKYGVADPFDVRKNVLAGAKWLRLLYLASDHNTSSVLAAYFWGLRNVNRYAEAKKPWPAQVTAYVDSVRASRQWLQAKAPAVGESATARLENAIEALAALNPTVTEIQQLNTSWQTWIRTAPLLTGDLDFLKDARREWYWNQYALRFEQAPITSITEDATNATPLPERIAPSLWSELLSRLVRPPRQMSLELGDAPPQPPPTVLQAEVREVEGEAGPGALTLLFVFAVWFVLQMGPKRR